MTDISVSPREIELDYEMCVFAVAIVLIRHKVTLGNHGNQFSVLQLATEMNALPFGEMLNFYIDPVALGHGLSRFKRIIGTKLGYVELITMSPTQNDVPMIPAYYNLPPITKGFNVKFNTITGITSLEISNEKNTLNLVVDMRNLILKQLNISSVYTSASSVFGHLSFRQQQKSQSLAIVKSPSEYNMRKSYSTMSAKSQNNYKLLVLKDLESKFGDDTVALLEGTLLTATKKRKLELETVSTAMFVGLNDDRFDIVNGDDVNENESPYDDMRVTECKMLLEDERVNDMLNKIKNRNIKWNGKEKSEIMSMFDTMKSVLVEYQRDGKIGINEDINTMASIATAEALVEKGGTYSLLNPKAIHRWNKCRDNVLKRNGRKVNQAFERNVWGRLIHCVLTNYTAEVNIRRFDFYHFFLCFHLLKFIIFLI